MDALECFFTDDRCRGWDYFILGLVVLGLLLAWRHVVPGVQLLARTLYHRRGALPRYLLSFADLSKVFVHVLLREKLLAAARLTVEWELLHPRPGTPMSIDKIAENRSAERRFQEDWSGDSQVAQAILADRQRYRRELNRWHEMRRRVLSGLLNPSDSGDHRFPVDSVFRIEDATDDIQRYFDTLVSTDSVAVDNRERFLSSIELRETFIIPLHLLAGLLERFDEQWSPVIQNFERFATHRSDDAATRTLRRRVAFQFVCWLVWGPSIPICTCRRWQGWRDRPVFQLGFGDENNSIPLMVDNPDAATKLFEAFASGGGDVAQRVTVAATLYWAAGVGTSAFAPAQADIANPRERRLLLRTDQTPTIKGGTDVEASALYYSAYLWIMFVVCDAKGRRAGGGNPPRSWEWLLPFFEHGNLAEPRTLLALKQQLAAKAMAEAMDMLAIDPELELHYVCALDDSGCWDDGEANPLAFPPAQGTTVRDLMEEAREAALDGPLRKVAERLVLHGHSPAGRSVSSCSLPGIIRDFQQYLAGEASER